MSCPAHAEAHAFAEDLPPAPGTVRAPPSLPGLVLGDVLGRGGFAAVYSGRTDDGAEVAVKLAYAPDDPRFAREAAALRRIGAPTCPALYSTGRAPDGRPFIVMERLAGQTLAQRLSTAPGTGALPLEVVCARMRPLCAAVSHVHSVGVVHRDLKPHNAFLCTDGRLALLDLGLARGEGEDHEITAAAPHLTRTGDRMGTALYMSPEQCEEARAVDRRTDIYALGVMLFEMLCGRPPFAGDTASVIAAHVSRRPPRPSDFADLPAAVDEISARCLAKRPDERFAEANEIADALDRARSSSEVRRAKRTSSPGPRTASTRRPVALLALRSRLPADQLAAQFAGERAQLARVYGDRYLFAFPAAPSPEAGIKAAARAAQALAGQTGGDIDAVVHVAELRVREREAGIKLAGSALERPADWWPEGGRSGLHLTAAAAQLGALSDGPAGTGTQVHAALTGAAGAVATGLGKSRAGAATPEGRRAADLAAGGQSAQPAGAGAADSPGAGTAGASAAPDADADADPAGFISVETRRASQVRSRISSSSVALVGRADLIAAAVEEFTTCFAGSRPTLTTLISDTGVGKSRVLEALGERLPRATRVLQVAARPPAAGQPEAVLRALLTAALDLTGTAWSAPAPDLAAPDPAAPDPAAPDLAAPDPAAPDLAAPDPAAPDPADLAASDPGAGAGPGSSDSASRSGAPPSAAAVERACIAQLGTEHGQAAWPAVALVLDAIDETDPRVRPILGAPGALRQTLARAAGASLRRLAADQPLAVLLDDAHWADQASLDALEMATLDGVSAPLWVAVATLPTLLGRRPLWGERAAHARQHTIGPLAPRAMRQLAHELLRPVEFVPDPVVDRLLEMTQGVPLYMVELIQALAARGAIRRHRGTQEWYVAADEIPKGAGATGANLAGQALTALPSHLVSLAGLCAVIADDISVAEINALSLALPSAELSLDPSFGLPRLVRLGLLRKTGKDRFGFRHPRTREAVEARIPPAQRKKLHAAALDRLRAQPERPRSARERIARHAAAAGQAAAAADALLDLAEEDRRRHRYVEAESYYSAALDQLSADDTRRESILGGRGRVRYRLQRFQEALADLAAARALAETRGADAAVADLLLEEATVLDWSHEWSESASRVKAAQPYVERLDDERLEARYRLARGRILWREDWVQEALGGLAEGADRASRLEDHDTRTVALLLLGPALAAAGRLDESESRFAEVIDACRERGDSLHLCAAFNNRLYLWMKRQRIEEATLDQRTAIELARELGFTMLEWGSTYNLAELLHWLGRAEEALPLAERSLALSQRVGIPVPHPALLLARVQCALGDHAAAGDLLGSVRQQFEGGDITELNRALHRLVELQVQDAVGQGATLADWTDVVDRLGRCAVVDEQVEGLHAASRWARTRGHLDAERQWILQAVDIAGESPIWKSRLQDVAAETTKA